jgi:co-chaperonin GroES (HSP10)
MSTYDPKKVLPGRDGWALVLADKREEVTTGGIILAKETGAEKVTEFAGEIIRLGDGIVSTRYRKQGLEEGCRIAYRGFLKYANPLPTEETWPGGSLKEFFFIDCADILGIVAPGVKVGVFSGRPSVPHIQKD